MIQIYNPGNDNYNVNGDMTLNPISTRISAALNEVWGMSIEHAVDEEGKWKSIVEGATIKAPSFNGSQLFTIKKVNKFETYITAEAEPIGMNAKDEVFIIDKRPTNKTGQEALDILTDGTRYSGQSNIAKQSTAYYQYVNLIEALNGGDNSFLNRWGGELLFDNFNFIINERVGGDYGLQVKYGFNIPANGFTEEVDTRELVTRIYPKAYNGYTLTGNGYVDSEYINSYPNVHAVTMTFDNVKMIQDAAEEEEADVIICEDQDALDAALTEQCRLQFAEGIDKPKVTIKADLVMLDGIVGYEDYTNLVKVGLGDTVHCKHSVLGITTTARVIGLVYDCILDKVTNVTLGDYQYNYFRNITSTMQRVATAIRKDGSVVAEQVQGFIDGAMAQLRLQNTIAKKQDVRAILFEDLDPESPTFGAMALGTQGFQISRQRTQDGRAWDWTTSATAAGIIADTIVAGLLSDRAGRNYWNLNTGAFSLNGAAISNANIDGYATDGELNTVNGRVTTVNNALESYAAVTDAAIADLQSQIDGQIDTWYYNTAPAMNKPPVTLDPSDPENTNWDTNTKKDNHLGDLYYDLSTGYAYRFAKENSTYNWYQISDSDVARALELARQAQATADSKMRVFVSTTQLPNPVPPYQKGDLWLNGSIIQVCKTAKTEEQIYSESDWEQDDTYAGVAEVLTAQARADEAYLAATKTYGACVTPRSTQIKVVTIPGIDSYNLYTGARLTVKFADTNTHSTPQLKVNGGEVKAIRVKGAAWTSTYNWQAGSTITFIYDGNYWEMETESQREVFSRLTEGGTLQGIYMENGNLYINGSYIKAGVIEGIILNGDTINGSQINAAQIDIQDGYIRYTRSGESATDWELLRIDEEGIKSVSADTFEKYVRISDGEILSADAGNERVSRMASGYIQQTAPEGETMLGWGELQLKDTNNRNGYVSMRTSDFTIRAGKPVSFSAGTDTSTTQSQFLRAVGNAVTLPGSLTVRGSKNRCIDTKHHGPRLLYAYETAEPYFGDIGEGKTDSKGTCEIPIEEIFSETIVKDYQVFIQAYGEGSLYVQKGKKSFTVKGTPNTSFAWEVKAKQIDLADKRLEEYKE